MAYVRFKNRLGHDAYLHMRIGPIDKDPAERGSSNTVVKDSPVDVDVGDGDVWYCFGNQIVNDNDDPALCNASSGETVVLDQSKPCYADN